MAIELTTATASQIDGITEALQLPGAATTERVVASKAQLLAAVAEGGNLILRLRSSIILTAALVIPGGMVVDFGANMLIKGTGGSITFLGHVLAGRWKIFSGFAARDIRGNFGQDAIMPEWWGITARTYGFYPATTVVDYRTPTNVLDLRDDVAINCAIQSFVPHTGGISPLKGNRVSLAAFDYYVSAPLDLSGTMSSLVGAGSGRTHIHSAANWAPTAWLHAEQWPEVSGGNHAAMIWIGGTYYPGNPTAAQASTYRTQVRGLDINCNGAVVSNWSRHVSAISALNGVEECSVIDDILIEYPSGFGIGFCRHRPASDTIPAGGGYPWPATVNGLTISNFWMVGPTKRDMVFIYLSKWATDCKIMVGTLSGSLAKSISSLYATAGAPGGANPEVYTVDPRINGDFRTYPLIAMVLEGCVSVENVHVEGVTIAACVREDDGGPSTVSIRNLDVIHMMDRARGAVYYADGLSGGDLVGAVTDYHGYSCVVLIAGYGETDPESGVTFFYQGANWRDSVTVSNITVQGGCTFLLRDDAYGIHHKAYGMGPAPATNGGAISFYSRGNIYARNPTTYAAIGTGFYDPLLPASAASISRTFFIGPIF